MLPVTLNATRTDFIRGVDLYRGLPSDKVIQRWMRLGGHCVKPLAGTGGEQTDTNKAPLVERGMTVVRFP